MSDKTPTQSSPDRCPAWANEQIQLLLQMEISLGNVPASREWRSNFVTEVQDRIFNKLGEGIDAQATEILFGRIVKGLAADRFSPEEILALINARIGYAGGPPYCNLDEVSAAL